MTHKLSYGHTPGETLPAHGGSSAVSHETRAEWLTRHVDMGHGLVREGQYDKCSCGDWWLRAPTHVEGHDQDPAQDGARHSRRDVLAPCGCRRIYDARGNGSDYGCKAHSERLADGTMPRPDFEDVLTRLELASPHAGAHAVEQASGEAIDYEREHATLMAWATERRRTMPIFREPLALRRWEP